MTQRLGSATIFSLAADPPAALPVDAAGYAELDAAFLIDGDDRHPCSIRKLSAAGATLRYDGDAAMGDALELELANGQRLRGTIAWSEGGEAGFLFNEAIDVIGTIARNLAALPPERRAVPRVELHQTLSVRHASGTEFTRTRNISQAGAGFETHLAVTAGDSVQLTFDGLRPLDATIRWARDGQAGVAFDEELSWQVLMPWLRQVQRHPANALRMAVLQETPGMIPDAHVIRIDAPARVREGVRWWNVQIRGMTSHLVEFEARAPLSVGTPLWIALPRIGGAPAAVIEAAENRFLCEFRLPLRAHEMGLISGGAPVNG